jgi:hypothetical protein
MSALSRKKRILDLALQQDNNYSSDSTSNKNNNEELSYPGKYLNIIFTLDAFKMYLKSFFNIIVNILKKCRKHLSYRRK